MSDNARGWQGLGEKSAFTAGKTEFVSYDGVLIDATILGDTELISIPTTKKFFLEKIMIEVIELEEVTGDPDLTIGKTSPSYSDLLSYVNFYNLSSAGKYVIETPFDIDIIEGGGTIYARVGTAATATNLKYKIYLSGTLTDNT